MVWRFRILNILSYIGILTILILIIYVALWEFGILKKEAPLPKDIENIKKEIDFLNNYNFKKTGEKLDSILPEPQLIQIPELKPEEIGKPSIFE